MEKEIKEIIEKNLPAHVGDVLQKRLTQADVDATTVKQQAAIIAINVKTIEELNARVKQEEELVSMRNNIAEREKTVAEKERVQEIANLQCQLAAEKDKSDFVKTLALGLVRNTEYRKTVFDNESQAGYSNGTNYVQPGNITKTLTEERKTE